ncbi:hypothetical protein HPB51_000141 [Rhipicephalus microplus]|uniref:Uncharacterized protein n=1 Tax=Rhipicephalus microplus TaxID=6941 RepID=A0A9J6DKB5_RHIMP|nr:hypothetical protein HPB51_000141 [Rhipicephalus microplus]
MHSNAGGQAKVEIDFRAAHDSRLVRVRVLGAIGDIAPQPFRLSRPMLATSVGVSCPLRQGDKYTAKFELAMSPTFHRKQTENIKRKDSAPSMLNRPNVAGIDEMEAVLREIWMPSDHVILGNARSLRRTQSYC